MSVLHSDAPLGLLALARLYREGAVDPRDVAEAFLARVHEGDVLRLVTRKRALAQANEASRRWRNGRMLGPLDGIPIVVKDLMDTEGDVTAAGSRVLMRGSPATRDAPVAARLNAAGALFIGKSTMPELAFAGLGMNPHTGTPGNACAPDRVPGGSSTGSAVAVARGWAVAAVGSDTGGSVRIPASFQELVGFKTSDRSLPLEGCVPLSTTLDTLGPIARDVPDAWALWLAMAAKPPATLERPQRPGRFWAPSSVWRDGAESAVAAVFDTAIARLRAAGHEVREDPLPELEELDGLYDRFGSFAAHEAWALYEDLIEQHGHEMDPRVTQRVRLVAGRPASDYVRLGYARERLRDRVWAQASSSDLLLAPTVAVQPPLLAPLLRDDAAYMAANRAVLRNTAVGNLLGAAAVSIPAGRDCDGLPVGLMLLAPPGSDALLLAWAAQVADTLA